MSGITAIFNRGGSVSSEEFDPVLDALAHRGQDGTDSITCGPVALGHQHFYTTPEAVGERQPLSLGDLWLTFDGRIDNRPELFEWLDSIGEPVDSEWSDAEVVLRGYRACDTEILDRLVGAFAFVLWDLPNDRLLVARDKTGIRELYYADVGEIVVISSEMQSILEHPAVSEELNEGLIAELLAAEYLTQGETFYADVREVRAGSFLDVTAGRTRETLYWEVGDAAVDLPADPVQGFLDRLEEAVTCRLRARALPGIMMSGGLDSTTIACLASRHLDRTNADGKLHSFSIVLDGVGYFEGERERIDTVVDACDLFAHELRANDHYALEDIELYEYLAKEAPHFGPTAQPSRALYEEATSTERNVMLAGVAGNVYDGNRFYYFDLLRSRRLLTFFRHTRSDPMPLRYILLWFGLVPSSDRLAAFVMKRYGDGESTDIPGWLAPNFVERSGLRDRLDEAVQTGLDSASNEIQFKRYFRTARQFGVANERRIALKAGVELRYPYLDSRLLEYAMSLPAGLLWEAGRDKALFRRATEGILPESVRTQSAAVHFDPLIDRGIEKSELFDELLTNSRLVELGIADERAYRTHVSELLERDGGSQPLWTLIEMELWLRQRA